MGIPFSLQRTADQCLEPSQHLGQNLREKHKNETARMAYNWINFTSGLRSHIQYNILQEL